MMGRMRRGILRCGVLGLLMGMGVSEGKEGDAHTYNLEHRNPAKGKEGYGFGRTFGVRSYILRHYISTAQIA
jgi:hypothetical protein